MKIETIHESLVNGQRRQMVTQIDEYTTGEFFSAYPEYLKMLYIAPDAQLAYLSDAVRSYHLIKAR